MRYKRHNFNKQIANLIRSTFDIVELMLWEIADSSEDNFDSIEKLYNSNAKIYDGIKDLIVSPNSNGDSEDKESIWFYKNFPIFIFSWYKTLS